MFDDEPSLLDSQHDVDCRQSQQSFDTVSVFSGRTSSQAFRDRTSCSLNSSFDSQHGSSSPCQFKKLPALNKVFIKQSSKTAICTFCNSNPMSNEIKRVMDHVKKCSKLEDAIKLELIYSYENLAPKKRDRNTMINEAWTRYIVDANVSFRSVERRSFKRFAKLCNRDWKPISRHRISQDYIPAISKRMRRSFLMAIKNNLSYLSVEFDHWNDITSRSILGVVFTLPNGDRFVQSLIDVSREGKSAQATINHLLPTMANVPLSTINSIVSDSASACKLARRLIVERPDYQHIIQHLCLAHLLNNMGKHFGQDAQIASSLEWASKITNFISHNNKLLAILEDASQIRPRKACATRWYSTINMIESLLDGKMTLLNAITENNDLTKTDCDWMYDESHWEDLARAKQILRPLADCIGIAERKDGTVGDAVKAILHYIRSLFMDNWGDPLIVGAISSVLTYFGPNKLGEEEFGLILAAYVLNRRNKCDFITEKGLDLVQASIIRIAEKNRCTTLSINQMIVEEFSMFCSQQGQFSDYQQLEQSAEDWWTGISACSSLRQIALRIARLRSSSANIERTFSDLKWMQGSRRTRLSMDTLTHIARIKIYGEFEGSSLDDIDEDDDDFLDSQQGLCSNDTSLVDSIVQDQLDIDAQQVTLAVHGPGHFDDVTRELFAKFKEYIDFSIVNEHVATRNDSHKGLTAGDKAELIAQGRSKRRSFKDSRANQAACTDSTEHV